MSLLHHTSHGTSRSGEAFDAQPLHAPKLESLV
jgi:hypothetical protein